MNERLPALIVALSCTVWAAPAQAETIEPEEAVAIAVRHHPLLRAATLEARRAGERIRAEEDRHALVVGADVGATRERVPALVPGGVAVSEADHAALGTDLAQTLPWGTTLGFRLEGSVSQTRVPLVGSEAVELGPGYGLAARLSVRQPLLRGAGTGVGEAELRARRREGRGAESERRRVASALLHDVLLAYWQLWLADEALRLAKSARALAAAELEQADQRIAAGALAPAAIHAFATRLAELDEALAEARLEQRARSLALATLLGRPDAELRAAPTPPAEPPMRPPAMTALARRAIARSPELAALSARIDAARERARLAGEEQRAALDLEGWVQAEGLGHGRVTPALSQLGTLGALSAHAGIRFEMPVTGSRRSAERAAARLAIEADLQRKRALEQRLASEARLLVERAATARRRIALARETVTAARAELEAARGRFEAGEAIALEVHHAADALRRAELRAARAQVDERAASLAIDHLAGDLLDRHARLAAPTGGT